jgi:uncharacterized protein (DUF1499 family)
MLRRDAVVWLACRFAVTTALTPPQLAAPRVASSSRITTALASRSRADDAQHTLRRRAALGLAAFCAAPAFAVECKTKPGALYAVRTCARYGVQGDGRLAGCLPSENCVSSSAIKSPAQFDAPWLFSPATRDADRAFEDLVKAAQASPDLKIAETDPARRYLRATAPSQISNYKATDVDDVEVLIPPQNIYSVPLGDNGSNRGRLEALRKALGWESTNPRPEDEVDSPGSYQALKFGM